MVMVTVKGPRAVSYKDRRFNPYKPGETFDCIEKEVLKDLLSRGLVTLVENEKAEEPEAIEGPVSDAEPSELSQLEAALQGKTVAELKAYAEEEGIELEKGNKAELVDQIIAVLSEGSADA